MNPYLVCSWDSGGDDESVLSVEGVVLSDSIKAAESQANAAGWDVTHTGPYFIQESTLIRGPK